MVKKQVLGFSEEFPDGVLRRDVAYDGVLSKPYDLPPFSRDPEKRKARVCSHEEQMHERIDALFRHYLVPTGDWKTLALKLADRHVPGFKEYGVRDTQRGRSTLLSKFPKLFDDVERKIVRGLTIDAACKQVAQMPGYSSLKAPSIKRRYYQFKQPFGPKKVRK